MGMLYNRLSPEIIEQKRSRHMAFAIKIGELESNLLVYPCTWSMT
jgi:hypothetical protein